MCQLRRTELDNLPAQIEQPGEVEPHHEPATPFIPSIPDVTRAAARWIRPLVPPFVARVIDTTTHPLRSARQVFEEVEEITFSLKRTHRVSLGSESSEAGDHAPRPFSRENQGGWTHDRPSPQGYDQVDRHHQRRHSSLRQVAAADVGGLPLGSRKR